MNLSDQSIRWLWVGFLVLASVILVQNIIIFVSIESGPFTGEATADVSLCLNGPPQYLIAPSCATAYTFVDYTCNLSATDADGNGFSNYTVTILSGNANGSSLFSNVSTDGILSFNANQHQDGNYTLQVVATDDAFCPLSTNVTINLTIELANGSPYLVGPIPNSTWSQDVILVPYNLNTYFVDPESDPLSFRATGNTQIAVSISSGGEVTLNPAAGYCGQEIIQFIATDVTNLTATSNSVVLTVECVEEASEDSSSSSSSSSGGGGGGGGGSYNYQRVLCVEQAFCYEWSECLFTKAVTEEGNEKEITIGGVRGTRTFLLDEPLAEGVDVFYEGYRWRECIDTNKCSQRSKYYVQSCKYKPSCFDFIQNQDETGVDCGGVCAPCTNCVDGIQNGLEEGVDCGGPQCAPCNSCTDGIMNGKEFAVDCGGPDCDACPSCFDGIQNGLEEGVDCGGPNCSDCPREEEPQSSTTMSALTRILVAAVLVAAILVTLAVLFRKYIIAFFSALALRYRRKNRVVFLSREAKLRILAELQIIEDSLGQEPTLQLQTSFSRVVRKYFGEAFGLDFEFTYEELQLVLEQRKALDLLKTVLSRFFGRSAQLEFSGVIITATGLASLISEFREIVYQTAVVTIDDMHERENDVVYRAIPPNVSLEDRMYLLTSNLHLAIQFNKLLSAETIYDQLLEVYNQLPTDYQTYFHPDLERSYFELRLALRHSHVQK